MPGYANLKLYWEEWGGYPGRDEPFGHPNLLWINATRTRAARCRVRSASNDGMSIDWSARWTLLPYDLAEPLPQLMLEIGVFGALKPLVESSPTGDYRVVHELTGVIGNRPFHFAIDFTTPGETWTLLGQRLMQVLNAVRRYENG